MDKSIGVLANLPPELEYLAEPAMKYGVHQFRSDIVRFFENATEHDFEAIVRVAERVRINKHGDLIDEFLDRYPMTAHPEAANLYFLFGIIDAAGLNDNEDDSWNTVDEHIKSLAKRGSFRLASMRMWAARHLADFGDEGRKAIPHLHEALEDDDFRVRVWAHYALAVIEGNRELHQQSIQQILSQHKAVHEDEIVATADAALEKLQDLGYGT